MNKKSILFKIGVLTAVFTLNAGLYISLSKKPEKVVAYNSSSLPTTIDLNDCGEQEIRSYYSSLNSLGEAQRQGTNLLKNLKTILSNGQKYYNYDSGSTIWQIYEISDRDWAKSPASSTTYGTYNANTNTITNYQYGTGNSNGKNNPYLHALYINRNITNQVQAWGNHNQDKWGINREHIWAKSHGFQAEGAGGARGDPMHLWAANGYANNIHSNNFYAFVDKSRTYTDCGDTYNTVYNNLSGYSKNAGGSQTVFEPQDCDKGDIARSVFYMVARYNNYANAGSGFDTNNPNLVLANDLSENSRTGTSSANAPYAMGLLRDLLAWNKLDPVDEYEIHRNNLLYKNYTNNRNPFIDFPDWADAIWGTANLDGTNYNSAITTSASPATDSISGIDSNAFGISAHSFNLEVNGTAEIYAVNADSNISWSIADGTVASLNKNSTTNNEVVTITALKAGTTTITATSGGNNVTCTITVGHSTNYGTLENPLSVDEAIDLISITGTTETEQPLYVKGVVTSNSAYNTQFSNFDYAWLQSDDGSEDEAFKIYAFKLSGIEGDYSSAGSMVGKEVVAYGYGKVYSGKPQLTLYKNHDPYNPLVLRMNDPEPTAVELDKETASINIGETTTLMATIVPNSAIGTIVWESSDEDVATVNNGVVTGISMGQVTITARVDEYDLEAECVVTVNGSPSDPNYYLNNTTSYAELTANVEGAPGQTATVTRSISQVSGTTTNGTKVTSLTLDSTITVSVNAEGYNGSVYGTGSEWRLYQSNSAVVTVAAADDATISSITFTFNTDKSGKLTYSGNTVTSGSPVSIPSSSTALFTVGSTSGSSGQVKVTAISVTYTTASSVAVNTVAINYGATISKANWDAINNLDGYQITDYGAMLVKKATLENNYHVSSVKEAYEAHQSVYIANKGSGAVPNIDGDNYFFYVELNVTRESNYSTVYVAAPFIKVNDVYYFLDELEYSVNTLAQYHLNNGGSDLSEAALNVLKGN